MSFVDEYGVQKEGQEKSKIQKEIETVEVDRQSEVEEEIDEGVNQQMWW